MQTLLFFLFLFLSSSLTTSFSLRLPFSTRSTPQSQLANLELKLLDLTDQLQTKSIHLTELRSQLRTSNTKSRINYVSGVKKAAEAASEASSCKILEQTKTLEENEVLKTRVLELEATIASLKSTVDSLSESKSLLEKAFASEKAALQKLVKKELEESGKIMLGLVKSAKAEAEARKKAEIKDIKAKARVDMKDGIRAERAKGKVKIQEVEGKLEALMRVNVEKRLGDLQKQNGKGGSNGGSRVPNNRSSTKTPTKVNVPTMNR
ncbi:hypothetical protein ScalyP_jg10458 [Parmales sp. scaly parma]|nr:hypothetical protein ScalyP_jg10458 [Parmales sp. scaly parma]